MFSWRLVLVLLRFSINLPIIPSEVPSSQLEFISLLTSISRWIPRGVAKMVKVKFKLIDCCWINNGLSHTIYVSLLTTLTHTFSCFAALSWIILNTLTFCFSILFWENLRQCFFLSVSSHIEIQTNCRLRMEME